MAIRSGIAACCLATAAAFSSQAARGQDVERYLWETPRIGRIEPAAVSAHRAELRREVQRVLDAGLLGPLRLSYADLPVDAYYVYAEPGRIITTLAWAYPHVASDQQTEIRTYVSKVLADARHAPWSGRVLSVDDGAVRSLHGERVREGRFLGVDGQQRNAPSLHVLYGLWLYGDRSGDWQAIQAYWPQVKAWYAGEADRMPPLYGQMGAHIAVARLARQFGDDPTVLRAADSLREDLRIGTDIRQVEQRIEKTRFAVFSASRNRNSFPGNCWMLLDLAPEIGRFLRDHPALAREVLRRTDSLIDRYPWWWLHQAPYFTRWTGDEGVGTTPELMGMIYPVERWVRQTPVEQLDLYLRSVPTGIGDCYWMESLVQTIEAHGPMTWTPVGRPD